MTKYLILLMALPMCVYATAPFNPLNPNALTIETNRSFNLGTLYPDNKAMPETLTISPENDNTFFGAGLWQGAPLPAQFTIHGLPGKVVVVSMPESLTLSSAGHTVIAKDFTSNLTNWQCTLDAAGTCVFNVGATISLVPNQTPGAYKATGLITAKYLMLY